MAESRRDGDWECASCHNNNYAFRTLCNRCKQPRLLVDSSSSSFSAAAAAAPPSNYSKWLPRIGDWICSGCTNNNYASREKCNKCGQPKDATAMPAIAVPAVYPRLPVPGVLQQSLIGGLGGHNAFRSSLPLSSSWPAPGSDRYGITAAPNWLPGGSNTGDFTYLGTINRVSPVPKGWRNGDWLCTCGFHNYSSRTECKNCKAAPPALGMKRLASDDHANDFDNKRLNAGSATAQYLPGINPYSGGGTSGLLQTLTTPAALFGKGAKQWRDGDWMCTSCNNHNYASRAQCNRCKAEKSTDAPATTT